MHILRMTFLMFILIVGTSALCQNNRETLTGYIDTYFNELIDNNPSAIPLAENATKVKRTGFGEWMI